MQQLNTNINYRWPINQVFALVIILVSVVMAPGILDLTLIPRFIIACLGILLLLYRSTKINKDIELSFDAIALAALAFTAYTCLSVFWANTFSEALFEASKQCLAFAVFIVSLILWKKNPDEMIKNLAKAAAVIVLAELLFVLKQLPQLPDFSKDSIYKITGLNAHKNLLSSFLFMQIFFLFLGFRHLNLVWKITVGIAILLVFILIGFLRTKAVWLGLGFTGATLLFLYNRIVIKKRVPTGFSPIVSLAIVLVVVNMFFLKLIPNGINKALQTGKSTLNESPNPLVDIERLTVWKKSYVLQNKYYFFGTGAGNWQIHFPDATLIDLWRCEDLSVTFQRPHNDFLWILTENGVIGFNLFIVFVAGLIILAIKNLHYIGQQRANALRLMTAISFLCGYFVISFFDFPKERIEHLAWLSILLAFVHSTTNDEINERLKLTLKLKPAQLWLLITVFSFFLLTGLLRLKGEYYTRLMYESRGQSSPQNTLNNGNKAMSFAYKIDPTSVPVNWYTGNALARLKNYDAAIKDFEKAYKLHPYNRNVLNDLASAYVFGGDKKRAIPYYEEAARISPRFDEPKLNLATIYLGDNDPEKALYWLNLLMHDSERRKKITQLANVLMQSKNTKQPQ